MLFLSSARNNNIQPAVLSYGIALQHDSYLCVGVACRSSQECMGGTEGCFQSPDSNRCVWSLLVLLHSLSARRRRAEPGGEVSRTCSPWCESTLLWRFAQSPWAVSKVSTQIWAFLKKLAFEESSSQWTTLYAKHSSIHKPFPS